MKIRLTLFPLILFASCLAQCGNQLGPWQKGTDIPLVHIESAAAALNNKLYVIGGFYTVDLEATGRVHIYDPNSNTWSEGKECPVQKSHTQAADWFRSNLSPPPKGVGRSIFTAAGYLGKHPGPASNQVWRYDTVDDEWERYPDLPVNRSAGGLVIDSRDRLHYISGLIDRQNDSGLHWYLDLRNRSSEWRSYSVETPNPRGHFPAVAFGDYLYIPGGVTGHDFEPLVEQDTFHRFDTYQQSWSELKNLPFPRSHSEAVTFWVNNRLVQVAGRNKNPGYPGVLNTIAEYDEASNSWQYLRSLPNELTAPAGGMFYNITFGGVFGDFLVITSGGVDYNIPRVDTWVSQVTWNCTSFPAGPSYRSESQTEESSTVNKASSLSSPSTSGNRLSNSSHKLSIEWIFWSAIVLWIAVA